MRKQGETGWTSPLTTKYADEAALQALIAASPELLPGAAHVPLAVVREMEVPSIGYVDVIGVDPEGNIILVECKLRANREIRRQVVGQVLAYGAGLWGLSYEVFERAYNAVADQPLLESVRAISGEAWSEEAFRAAVAANLTAGRFKLIIAVDEITEELKRIVVYLNEHTAAELKVMALELRYSAHEGFEFLVPHVYGEESAQPKTTSVSQRWTEESFFARLEAFCAPQALEVARELFRWLIDRGGQFYWGNGSLAWVSAAFLINGKRTTLVGLGEYPIDRGVFSIYFDTLRLAVEPTTLVRLAEQLRSIPGAAGYYRNLEAKEFRQRPNLLLDPVLTQPGACQIVKAALTELLEASSDASAT